MDTIAVIGATGMLGQPVTRELIRAGFAVRVVARHVNKARALFPETPVVPGDMTDIASLRQALTGMHSVYLNLSVTQPEKPRDFHTETQGMANLLVAARQAGVQRIGYLSSLVMRYQGMNGFRWWVFDVKQQAVALLKNSGIAYSIFYPSCFMDSMLHTQRLGNRILLVGHSPVEPWYIAAADYSRQVARALGRVQAGDHQEYIIQGPAPLTQHEAAHRLSRLYTKEPLRVVTVPPLLLKMGSIFSAQADYGWHITEAINKYPETFEASRAWADLGKPEITLDQFAGRISQ